MGLYDDLPDTAIAASSLTSAAGSAAAANKKSAPAAAASAPATKPITAVPAATPAAAASTPPKPKLMAPPVRRAPVRPPLSAAASSIARPPAMANTAATTATTTIVQSVEDILGGASSTMLGLPIFIVDFPKFLDEYDPADPNDYEKMLEARVAKQKRREQMELERQREMEDEEMDRRREQEMRKFAPPPSMYSSASEPVATPPQSGEDAFLARARLTTLAASGDEAFLARGRLSQQHQAANGEEAFLARARYSEPTPDPVTYAGGGGGGGGGGSIGQRIMSKMGWKEGQGLGRQVPLESRVILLRNMVGPGEVDDSLESETMEECSVHGPVEQCRVYEVGEVGVPAEEAVRIFVKFATTEGATKALTSLNGRYFAKRQVKVEYYDCDKFDRQEFLA